MSQFYINTDGINHDAEYMNQIARQLEYLVDDIKAVRDKLSSDTSINDAVITHLDRISSTLESKGTTVEKMSDALKEISYLYQNTENRLIAQESYYNGTVSEEGKASDSLWFKIKEMIRKILEALGIIPGGGNSEGGEYVGDPVNVCTGNYISDVIEISSSGLLKIEFIRHYNSLFNGIMSMGSGWSHCYEASLEFGDNDIILCLGDQTRERFISFENEIYKSAAGLLDVIQKTDEGYTFFGHGGEMYLFSKEGKLLSIYNRIGNRLTFSWSDDKLCRVEDNYGRFISFAYNEKGFISGVSDCLGRNVELFYENTFLVKVISADKSETRYTYDGNGRLKTLIDGRGITRIVNTYDDDNRIIRQDLPDGTYMEFKYDGDSVIVRERNGEETVYTHNNHFLISNIKRTNLEDEKWEYDEHDSRSAFYRGDKQFFKMNYDEKGRICSFINAEGQQLTMSYDDNKEVLKNYDGECSSTIYDSNGNVIEKIDAEGNSVKFKYKNNLLWQVINPDETTKIYEYDLYGNIIRVVDEEGNATGYVYDAMGRKIKMIDPNGYETSFTYDPMDRLATITDAKGNIRNYYYNEIGKVRKITDFDGKSVYWEYNDLGLTSAHIDKESNKTLMEYDCMSNLSKLVHPNGCNHIWKYDERNLCIQEIDESGNEKTYHYNENGKLDQVISGEMKKSYLYDSLGNVKTIVDEKGKTDSVVRNATGKVCEYRSDKEITTYEYNKLGLLVKKTDSEGLVTRYEYDCRRNLVAIISKLGKREYIYYKNLKLSKVVDENGNNISFEYDSCGNNIRKTWSSGYELNKTFDELNRVSGLSDNEGRSVIYNRDECGRVVNRIDSKGNIVTYSYSPNGKITQVVDAKGDSVSYKYDNMGYLISISQGGDEEEHITKLQRNDLGKIIKIEDAQGNSYSYDYSLEGRLLYQVNPEGEKTSYHYYGDGNVSKIKYEDCEVKLEYDSDGKLISMEDWAGVTSLTYNQAGRTAAVRDFNNNEIRYLYNDEGGISSIVYPDGKTVEYTYDDHGRILTLKTSEEEVIEYSYDSNGNLHEKKMGKVREVWNYLPSGRIKSITYFDNNMLNQKCEFEYDSVGNIVGRTILGNNGEDKMSYSYDENNRLTEVCKNGVVERVYEYDQYGNRSYYQDHDKKVDYSINVLNQIERVIETEGDLETVTELKYDRCGRLIETNEIINNNDNILTRYEYDCQGNISRIVDSNGKKISYTYDGSGLLRNTSVEDQQERYSEQYVHDLNRTAFSTVAKITTENDHITTEDFLWDGSVAGEIRDGKTYQYLVNHQGTVERVFDTKGTLSEERDFDEFGNIIKRNGSVSHSVGYTGLFKNPFNNSWLTSSRQYNPNLGRFMSRDSVKYIHVGNSLTTNLYSYCLNNPLIYLDPLGTDCYIFYLPEWESEALADQRALAEKYGYDISKVHIVPVTNAQELTDGWNGMGTVNGESVDIDTVVINSHANPNVLGFGNSGSDPFRISDIQNLQNQDMEQLVLYGCNAGHQDYIGTNVASEFSRRTNGAPVMASDGTVSGRHSTGYDSMNDEHYRNYLIDDPNRDNRGWAIYQQVDGQTVVIQTGAKELTLAAMVSYLWERNRLCPV